VVLGPVGGTFADRHSRIRIALICDLLAGVAVLALAFALFDPRVERLEPAAVRFVIALMFGVSALIGILRAFFNWWVAEEEVARSPMDRVPVPIDRPDQIQPFTHDQLNRMVAAAKKTLNAKRDEAILLLMLGATVLRAVVTNISGFLALALPIAMSVGREAGLNPLVCALVVMMTGDAVIYYPAQSASALVIYERGHVSAGETEADIRRGDASGDGTGLGGRGRGQRSGEQERDRACSAGQQRHETSWGWRG
jgi:hypothetical protein